ncbi:MAG: ABC transporter ATP-binding protein [Treponema sp.]|jgi:iron complex transport system ATP-binding protein|nr:ABC transporter ATP-binding protein [Treponema sp.]
MLKVKNLYSGYGGPDIIRDIHLQANPGEILAVIGPNGCGKTTLLKTLAKLLPYRGEILLEQTEISLLSRKNLARKIALLAQTTGIYFPYSVYDTAALGRYSHSTSFFKNLSREDKEIISQVLIKLELMDVKDRLISELSGGQLQRVFLARTLVQNPDLILLDEPTNHLDLKHQVELLEYLSYWAKENNKAVIAVLHDLNLARRYADNAALMCNGMMVSSGKCESVLSGDMLKETYGLDIRAFMIESLQKWQE